MDTLKDLAITFLAALSGVVVVLMVFLLSSCSISYTYVNQKYADTEKNKITLSEKSSASGSASAPCDTTKFSTL